MMSTVQELHASGEETPSMRRFSIRSMLFFVLLCAVVTCIYKSISLYYKNKNSPRLHAYASTYVLPNRSDLAPIRIIGYSVSYPGSFSDLYIDDCTGVEPGNLNKVSPGNSMTLYYADEPGLKTQTSTNLPQTTNRMKKNFELLKEQLASQIDTSNLDWNKSVGGNVFSIVIQLPDDFPAVLP